MIIGRCTFSGCSKLTIGTRCVDHDLPVTRTFIRGRPFLGVGSMQPASAGTTRAFGMSTSTSLVPGRRTAEHLAQR
jgi:hypothetical protein